MLVEALAQNLADIRNDDKGQAVDFFDDIFQFCNFVFFYNAQKYGFVFVAEMGITVQNSGAAAQLG